MALAHKILICFFLGFAVNTYAQTYPKYTTKQAKGNTTVKTETEAVITKDAPADKEVAADFNALMRKAANEYLNKEYAKAVSIYTEAFAVSPDELKYVVLQKRAWSYFALENFDKSIEDCTAAIEKTSIPNENIRGALYVLRSMGYKLRGRAGDMERACADHQKAREAGVIKGKDLEGYDCNKK